MSTVTGTGEATSISDAVPSANVWANYYGNNTTPGGGAVNPGPPVFADMPPELMPLLAIRNPTATQHQEINRVVLELFEAQGRMLAARAAAARLLGRILAGA